MEPTLESILKQISNEDYRKKLQNYLINLTDKQLNMLSKISDNLNNLKLGEQSIIVAFLYTAIDKNSLDYGLVEKDFGKEISNLLKSLNTVESNHSDSKDMSFEEIRSMLFAMSKDIRALIILLSYVQYKMDNLEESYPDKYSRDIFVKAVQEIYSPISGRLGLNENKNNLEDSCFKYLDPISYKKLSSEEALNKDKRQVAVDFVIEKIERMLEEMGIEAKVYGRQKHLASVYKKMKQKEITLAQIYDLVAVRVIVKTIEQCYEVLGKINTTFAILPERFKDYISSPKPNGYQSIHTCIISDNNRPIEVQIRTEQMHEYCEYGIAAHWIYKERKTKTNTIDDKMNWFRKIIEENKDLSNEEFIDSIKTDLFVSEIFAQTPNGKIIKFPLGANCIDFAYAIHSDIGNKCIGAKINGKIKPLNTALANGDICEILTSNQSKGPSRDWLKIVKTSSARSKISSYFRKELVDENIKNGKSILERCCKDNNLDFNDVFYAEKIQPVLSRYSMANVDELFAAVGYGSLSSEKVINKIDIKHQKNIKTSKIPVVDSGSVIIDGQQGMLTRFAGCCSPIPGDSIVGFVSRGLGVTIHRADCPNLKYLEKGRLVEAHWSEEIKNKYKTKIKVIFDCENYAISSLTKILDSLKITLLELHNKTLMDGKCEINFSINIASTQLLTGLLKQLRQLPIVISAIRIA